MEMKRSMKRAFGRSPQEKARRRLGRTLEKTQKMVRGEKASGKMGRLRAKGELSRMKDELSWKDLLGLLGGAAALAAFMAVGRSMARSQSRKSLAQSGQAPGRSHVQISSHPAAQSRYQPEGRQLGGSPQQR